MDGMYHILPTAMEQRYGMGVSIVCGPRRLALYEHMSLTQALYKMKAYDHILQPNIAQVSCYILLK